MSNNKKIITLVGLIILLAFSFLMFFGIDTGDKSNIEICSFVFTLITEIIIFGNVIVLISKKLNAFLIAGLSSLVTIYSIVSLLFNILFVSIFNSIRSVLIFNFGLLLIYGFIVTILFLFKREK